VTTQAVRPAPRRLRLPRLPLRQLRLLRLPRRLRRLRGDAGYAIPWQLIRLTLLLATLAVVGHDAAAVGLSMLNAEDASSQAAVTGSATYQETKDVQQAYRAAQEVADDHDLRIRPDEFTVNPDGSVTTTLRGDTGTLVVKRIGWLSQWTTVEATGSGSPVLS